jgi:hypothetical protein
MRRLLIFVFGITLFLAGSAQNPKQKASPAHSADEKEIVITRERLNNSVTVWDLVTELPRDQRGKCEVIYTNMAKQVKIVVVPDLMNIHSPTSLKDARSLHFVFTGSPVRKGSYKIVVK